MALETLDLTDNKLPGPIPAELGQLGVLSCLYLGNNELGAPRPHPC
jgi:hypothetical protein